MVIFSLLFKKKPHTILTNAKKQGKDIEYLLKSHAGFKLLLDYAEICPIEETVMFLNAVYRYKKKTRLKTREYVSLYHDIIETYILCNSPYEINIPDKTRKTLLRKPLNDESKLTIFDEVYAEMERLFWLNVHRPSMITQYTCQSYIRTSPFSDLLSLKRKWFTKKIYTM